MDAHTDSGLSIHKRRRKIIIILEILVIILALVILVFIFYCMGVLKFSPFAILIDNTQIVSSSAENFIESTGISQEEISNITEVNLSELPKEINVKDISQNDLAVYQINYNDSNNLFVIKFA